MDYMNYCLHALKAAILLCFVTHGSGFVSTGPYKVNNLHLFLCEDQGTNELNLSLQMYRTQDRTKRILAHRGALTWPSKADNYTVLLNAYKWGTDWTFMSDFKEELCKAASMVPRLHSGLFEAMGIELTCPPPPGAHPFEEWIVDFKPPFEVLPYGKYKGVLNLFNGKKEIIGSVCGTGDVVQKYS